MDPHLMALAMITLGGGISATRLTQALRAGESRTALIDVLATATMAVGFAIGDNQMAHFFAGMTAVIIWIWWNGDDGKRKRRAARQLGDKSRARIQALVRQLAPAPNPA